MIQVVDVLPMIVIREPSDVYLYILEVQTSTIRIVSAAELARAINEGVYRSLYIKCNGDRMDVNEYYCSNTNIKVGDTEYVVRELMYIGIDYRDKTSVIRLMYNDIYDIINHGLNVWLQVVQLPRDVLMKDVVENRARFNNVNIRYDVVSEMYRVEVIKLTCD